MPTVHMQTEAQFLESPSITVRANPHTADEPPLGRLFTIELAATELPYTGAYLRFTMSFRDLLRLQAALADAIDQAIRADDPRVEVRA